LLTAAVGGAVLSTTWWIVGRVWHLSSVDRALLSGGAALLCCATTHNVSPWFASARSGPSSLTESLADLARASALIPAVALSFVISMAPGHGLVMLEPGGRALVAPGTGVLLGILATLLLGREFRSNESWGLLLGLALVGAGLSVRIGLSSVTTAFCMGLTISLTSRHAEELRAMVARSEKAVMLPVALLAGAAINPQGVGGWLLLALVAGALGARFAAEVFRGFLLWVSIKSVRPGGPWLGFALTTTGGFTLAAAVELHYALGPPLGSALLVLGAVGAVVGAVVGPLQLRRVLGRAGELDETEDSAPSPDRIPAPPHLPEGKAKG
jgi:Kef-type K+ transport system membrane component KefB